MRYDQIMVGKVWLVGAGPGDAGLFTLKGKEILGASDVVVYDALVGQAILNMIPDSAEVIYAGKRSGNHALSQEEINQLLFREAQKGKQVVRLKGGDPFVFGRGGEELELLAEHNIPFEVVPGVTSAFAVPAYNGIPVTHRDFCSSVHVITGHRRRDKADDIDFKSLVRAKGTLIFLMGIAALPEICQGLLDAGMDASVPAAVLERGTTAAQHRILATVGTLEDACKKHTVQTPAIIVVGEVCGLLEAFSWYEKRSLAGVKVLVTRPKELASTLTKLLVGEGAEILELPAIRTMPICDANGLCEALDTLEAGGYDWVVFTSPSGVRIFFERLFEKKDIRILAGVKIAVIGEGSKKTLRGYGLKEDFMPDIYEGKILGQQLAKQLSPGSRILIPRAAIGNPQLVEELQRVKDVQISDIATYETVYASSHVMDEKQVIESGEVDFAMFTSASTVRGFAASVGDIDYSKVRAICIGRQTQAAATALGMQTWVSENATLVSMVQRLKEAVRELWEENQRA